MRLVYKDSTAKDASLVGVVPKVHDTQGRQLSATAIEGCKSRSRGASSRVRSGGFPSHDTYVL